MAISLIKKRGELPLIDAQRHELDQTISVLSTFALSVNGKEISFHPLVADDLTQKQIQRLKYAGVVLGRDAKLKPQEAMIYAGDGTLVARVIGVQVDDEKFALFLKDKRALEAKDLIRLGTPPQK